MSEPYPRAFRDDAVARKGQAPLKQIVRAEVAKTLAEAPYEEFDQQRKRAEAAAADAEDLLAIEALEQRGKDGHA